MSKPVVIAVIQFPGSNCERETCLAIERAGMEARPFLWNEPTSALADCDGFIIVGGFSYEDRSRAGVIASLDPVMATIKVQAQAGKPVLGICNGAQVLVEAGLVPGLEHNQKAMALTTNRRVVSNHVVGTGYYNAWVHLKVANNETAFTCALEKDAVLHMPIAHAEGRFMMPDSVLKAIQTGRLIAFQYCNEVGDLSSDYPINPNGSVENIAAVCNLSGNVMAIMPHPERTAKCDGIFESMKRFITEKRFAEKPALSVDFPAFSLKNYQPAPNSKSLFVALIITDNQAETVKTALKRLGVVADIKRYVHWEVVMSEDLLAPLIKSGELLNTNKEKYVEALPESADYTILVRDKDDVIGLEKCETLQTHFGLSSLQSVAQGVVWQVTTKQPHALDVIRPILFNPHAHEVYSL